jgi:hypothetical protein
MNMNKKDNDRMYNALTQHYEGIEREAKRQDAVLIAICIAAILAVGMGMIAMGVDTYLKLKNNGSRNTNVIELGKGRP